MSEETKEALEAQSGGNDETGPAGTAEENELLHLYKTEAEAARAVKKKDDPGAWKIFPVRGGGFVLMETGRAPSFDDDDDDDLAPVAALENETYFLVRFSAKANPYDPDDVMLAVNGETLVMRREAECVVPGSFLECCDHARHPVYRQLPNQPRKVVGHLKTFPYDRIREATREEFLAQRADGNRRTAEAIRRYGYDYNPEELEMSPDR